MHQRIEQEISYLRGFLAGDQTMPAKQQQVFDRMISVMEELAEASHQLNIRLTELEEYVEAVDEDLNEVEQIIFDEEDMDLIKMTCPACEEEVLIDQEDLEDPTIECLCPNCQAILMTKDTSDQSRTLEPSEHKM